MTTYIVHGFHRSNHANRVCILVEAEKLGDSAITLAKRIVNDPDICFLTSMNISEAVPDDAKGVLFNGDAELYAKVPQLDPEWQKKQRRATKPQQRAAQGGR